MIDYQSMRIINDPLCGSSHRDGCLIPSALVRIEHFIKQTFNRQLYRTMETGCGRSSVLFSNLSQHHLIFTLDDRDQERSSVNYVLDFQAFNSDNAEFIMGCTQTTLPSYNWGTRLFDCVLLDGPHGWPFPDLEYYWVYDKIRPDGILLVDDVNIPTVGRMADIIAEDKQWEFHGLVDYCAVFTRTSAPVFDRLGDGWWLQRYNCRRTRIDRLRTQDYQQRRSFVDLNIDLSWAQSLQMFPEIDLKFKR